MTQNPPYAFGEMVDLYDEALCLGVAPNDLFARARDRFISQGCDPLKAASLVRCILAVVAKRHGHELYDADEMARLVGLATGENSP